VKIVCGRCSAEVELPKEGEGPQIRCPSCAAVFVLPSLAEGEELARPDMFPGYRVVALVGHGGMGAVYRAVQLSMDREVAIKVLLRKYAAVPRSVARFERESGALATLNHPNIVGVIDRGRVGDTYYFVMEYVHGRTLRYLIKNGQVSVERAVDAAIQICHALEAAHAAGVVHRDIKPGNILIEEADGLVKVADFGIAHMVEQDDAGERRRRSRLGTAKYMAPEQRGTGEGIDARADLYGLGVTLHEMLTGELPSGQPPSVSNRFVPKELDAIVERATRTNRDERFQSAVEMCQALDAARQAVKGDETSVTEVLPAEAVGGPTCPICRQAVEADDATCPTCRVALFEPCYRFECEGVNRLGAERCAACGGHLKLMERHRRAELEEFLEQAEAEIAAGEIVEAPELLEEVETEPHVAFSELRKRARELSQRLALLRPASVWRPFVVAAVAVFVVGLALLVYWRLAMGPPKGPPDDGDQAVELTSAGRVATPIRVATRVQVQPRPPAARPADAFTDYLLAVSDEAWSRHAPPARLLAACDAGLFLAAGRNNGEAGKRLAKTLADIGRADAPPPEALRARAGAALDALCGTIARELGRHRTLARSIRPIVSAYSAAARTASDPLQLLPLAAAALHDLLAAAETHQNPKPDLPTRLLLLEGGLRAAAQDDLLPISSRVIGAGRFLVRYLRRDAESAAFPEFLNDAQQKLARAEHTREPLARLAYGVEAFVEALGARPAPRAGE